MGTPVRPARHRHARHRLGQAPGRHQPRRHLRRLHPDRRRHQPRQLRRAALQPARRGGRHQHRHRLARRSARASASRCPSAWPRRCCRSSARRGKVTRGFVGVQVSDLTPDLAQGFNLKPGTKGALVQLGGPALAGREGRAPARRHHHPAQRQGGRVLRHPDPRAWRWWRRARRATLTVLRGGDQKQFASRWRTRPRTRRPSAAATRRSRSAEAKDARPAARPLARAAHPRAAEQARAGGRRGAGGDQRACRTARPSAPACGAATSSSRSTASRSAASTTSRPHSRKLKENDLVLLRVRRGDQSSFLTLRMGAGSSARAAERG